MRILPSRRNAALVQQNPYFFSASIRPSSQIWTGWFFITALFASNSISLNSSSVIPLIMREIKPGLSWISARRLPDVFRAPFPDSFHDMSGSVILMWAMRRSQSILPFTVSPFLKSKV